MDIFLIARVHRVAAVALPAIHGQQRVAIIHKLIEQVVGFTRVILVKPVAQTSADVILISFLVRTLLHCFSLGQVA